MPQSSVPRRAVFLLAGLASLGLLASNVSGFSQASAGDGIRVSSRLQNDQVGGTSTKEEDRSNGTSSSVLLFEDYSDASDDVSTINAKFGEFMPLKKPASFGESMPLKRPASFGESVPLKRPTENLLTMEDSAISFSSATPELPEELKTMKQRNLIVAIASVFLAVSSYFWDFTHPVTPVQLLATMQAHSAPLTAIGNNGRPTVVDFWAPWCENCKMAAPTLQKLEEEYKDKVNFVMINGDAPEAWPLIERFGVDGIPHMAMISAEGDVETALIGPIPKRVLEADLEVMLENAAQKKEGKQELPYKMLDVFAGRPDMRRIDFQTTTTWE